MSKTASGRTRTPPSLGFLEDGTFIVLVMAFIAMLGALAAFRTATVEQECSERESKLNERQIIEMTKRQEYVDRVAQYARFKDEYDQHVSEGQRLRNEADQLRNVDPVRAARRDVDAQEEFNAARILRPYFDITWVRWLDSNLTLRKIIDKNVSYDLQHIGYGSQWTESGESGANSESIWKRLDADIERGREKLVLLTLGVVVFVTALGCLTFAELWRRRRKRMLVMLATGLLVAAGGVILTISSDPASKRTFLAYAIAFAVLGFLGSKLSPLILTLAKEISVRLDCLERGELEEKPEGETPHPGEVEPLLFPGVRLHVDTGRRPFSILVILLIVVTVLLSAIVGYVYGKTRTEASHTASTAVELLVESFKNSQSALAHYSLGSRASAQEQLIAYQAALQRLDLARMGFLKIDQEEVEQDEKHWKNLLNRQKVDFMDSVDGADKDSWGPPRFLYGSTKKAYGDFAQSDAENELSLAFRTRAHWYLMTLTWLAIGLYLFGQSLAMSHQLKAASTLVFFGSCLLIGGTAIAVVEGSRKLPGGTYTANAGCADKNRKAGDASSEAARHYAEGMIRYNTANTRKDYAAASKEFECAVEARPTFALANYYLSRASTEQSSPQNEEGFVSLVREETMKEIVGHEKNFVKSLRQDRLAEDAELMGDYGFDSYLLGLIQKDNKLVNFGLQETKEAIRQDGKKELPFLRFNLGVALLAAGRNTEAMDAYHDALRASPDDMQDGIAAASINDLAVFLHYCQGIREPPYCNMAEELASGLKQQFVAATWPVADREDYPKDPPPQVSDIGLVASPAGLGWHARLDNFTDRDLLVVMWYKYEDEWNIWRVLPKLSMKVESKNTRKDAEGNTREFRPYLKATNEHQCAEKGEYRAEFYLNGKRLDLDPRITLDFPPLTAATFPDLNISLCHPAKWERWPHDLVDDFMVGGYTTSDHSQGIFVFNYYLPRWSLDEAAKKRFAERSLTYLSPNNFFSENGFSAAPNTCPVYPHDQTVIRTRSGDGTVRAVARVWASEEGIVHVGVALHRSGTPGKAIRSAELLGPKTEECSALRSMREVYAPY